MHEILHPRKGLQKLSKATQQNAVIRCFQESRGSLFPKILYIYDVEGSRMQREKEDLELRDSVAE